MTPAELTRVRMQAAMRARRHGLSEQEQAEAMDVAELALLTGHSHEAAVTLAAGEYRRTTCAS